VKRRAPQPIGIAVVGAGKIGRHRARLASEHAGVGFLAIADIDGESAQTLADEVGADLWTTSVAEAVGHTDVGAVIVSTHEAAHTEPVIASLRAGRPTLVEKPIALTLGDADRMLDEARKSGVDLWVGYSMRYAQRYAVGHDRVADKQIGTIIGGLARCYDTLAVASAILGRSPTATPVMDILTYLVDVIGWYHPLRPVEVVARSHGSILRSRGHDVDDLTFAMVTYEDGAVFDLGTSYSLPEGFPINGMAVRIELLGTDGVLQVTEDHGDQVLYSGTGHANEYVDQHLNLTYLGSRTSGEWAGGRMFGRVADETRAWLDHLTTGAPCHITPGHEARQTLAVTLAIDESARTGTTIRFDGP
jgi:predicted dehydrogenase